MNCSGRFGRQDRIGENYCACENLLILSSCYCAIDLHERNVHFDQYQFSTRFRGSWESELVIRLVRFYSALDSESASAKLNLW